MKNTWQKLFIYFLVFVMCVSILAIFNVSNQAQAAGGNIWHVQQQTSSAFDKVNYWDLDMALSGSKLYFAWSEKDSGGIEQIWTAEMNNDGTGWTATKRTTSTTSNRWVRLDIEGTKIYYIWSQRDTNSRYQIWTADSNLDGSGWSANQRTTYNGDVVGFVRPDLDVVSTTEYIVWEAYGTNTLYTAVMNTDGSGFNSQIVVNNNLWSVQPRLKVVGSTIYYIYSQAKTVGSGQHQKIVTATMNTNQTGFSAIDRVVMSGTDETVGVEQIVDGNDIYYVWMQSNGGISAAPHLENLWLAKLDTNNNNFDTHLLWQTPYLTPRYEYLTADIALDGSILYLSWNTNDNNSNYQIYSATINTDFTNFRPTKRTNTSYDSSRVKILVDGDKVQYSYFEIDSGNKNQIWTSYEDNTQVIDESTTVTASVPSSLSFTSSAVTAGAPCHNSGGNAEITTTGTAVDFGIYTGGEDKFGCQQIAVSTNATDGYVTTMQINRKLTNSTNDVMDSFAGGSGSADTWITPETWTSPVSPNDSYFGWTSDDTTDYIKFAGTKYAAFVANATPYAVATEPGPVVNETNYITFRLELGNNQEAGIYTASVMYITTATY